MKGFFAAFLLCFLIFGARAVTWDGTVTVGDWETASNWIGGVVPNSGDTVNLVGGTTVRVTTSSASCNILNTASNLKIVVISNAVLTASNVTQIGTNTIVVENNGAFVVNAYFLFSGNTLQFDNQGLVTLNPFISNTVGAGVISNNPLGKDVIFRGTRNIFLSGDLDIPANGFVLDTGVTQIFESLGSSRTVTFRYAPTVPSNNWRIINDLPNPNPTLLNFNAGATFSGNIQVTNNTNTKPSVTFNGDFTVNGDLNFQNTPNFASSSAITFNGGSITWDNIGCSFDAPNIQGSTTFNFRNTLVFPSILAATFGNQDILINKNIVFTGIWRFAGNGNKVQYNIDQAIGFNLTLQNVPLVFLKTATINSPTVFINGGSGSITYTNTLVSNTGITYTGFNPVFDCTLPAKAFSVQGTSSMNFPNGLTVNGCTVTTSASFTIDVSLTTNGGNTTMPSSGVSYSSNSFVFNSAGTPPTNTLFSTTVTSGLTVPASTTYTANSVELIFTQRPTLSTNSALSGSGLMTFLSAIQCSNGNVISVKTAFPSGTSTIIAANRVDWSGQILLRNTNLAGTGDIWFTGSIVSTKGVSSITNPNFKFKSGISLTRLYDNFPPDIECQLVIDASGTTTTVIEGAVNAGANSNIIFDDNLNANSTGTTSFSTSSSGAITFRQTGLQGSITTVGTVNFSNNLYVNNTNFRFSGVGSYNWQNNINLYVQGSINNPRNTGDAFVQTSTNFNVFVVANSIFGETISIQGNLQTRDFDQNPLVASTSLTLATASGEARNIQGTYDLETNLIFNANVIISSPTLTNKIGSITILGNSVFLQSSANWRNRLILSSATTVTASGAFTWTLGEQDVFHGLTLPGSLTVNVPATVAFENLFTLSLSSAATAITGTGATSFSNMYITCDSNTKTFSTQTSSFNNVTVIGTGSLSIQPVSSAFTITGMLNSYVTTTITSSTVTANNAMITPTVVFSANPITLMGSGLTVMEGDYTLNGQWINNAPISFRGTTTLSTSLSFVGTGSLTFNTTLILTRDLTLTQDVTFGFNKDFLVTVSNNNFRLTLTGNTITVVGNVVSNGGSILSTSQSTVNPQNIVGGGVIDSSWTWSNSVKFSNLNITSTRTLTFDLYLTSGQITYFTDGVVFNGGTFALTTSTDTPTLGLEKTATTNSVTTLIPNIAVQLSSVSTETAFTFSGASNLFINGTFTTRTSVVFTNNVILGWATPTTANVINLSPGTQTWGPSGVTLSLYRTSINVPTNGVNAQINTNLRFEMNSMAVTASTLRTVTFVGTLTLTGTGSYTGTTGVFLGVTTINTLQNCTVSGFSLTGALTFSSTTNPWVEPVFSLPTTLTQTLVLNGPVRMPSPTFAAQSRIVGTSRLAITDTLTISNADFMFEAPVQLYVTSPGASFSFSLTGTQSYLTFPSNPSLFNPVLPNNLSIVLSSSNPTNVLHFKLSAPITFGDITINSGTLRFTGSTLTTRILRTLGDATLWIDGTAVTVEQLIFNQNTDGSSPSNFIFSLSSATPPAITAQKAVYKGTININVVNFNWNGNALTIISTVAANGATGNFIAAYGTPGFSYASARSGTSLQITRLANPSVSPFPTQSNGPSPGVSSAAIYSINFVLLACMLILFVLN